MRQVTRSVKFRWLKILIAIFVLGGLWLSCKKPYNPAIVATDNNYLVIEGIINTGGDSTKIKLSRTVNLSDTARTKPEYGAKMYIEDDHNRHYDLTEIAGAVYTIPSLNLQDASKCRLHIVTSLQKEYVSDYTEIVHTPQIDSISYAETGNGIQLYANTHDAAGKVRYFKWDYDETWQFTSYYNTILKYENGGVAPRRADDRIYYCFKTTSSNQILLGSSAALSQAVISKQPLAYVAEPTGKLQRGYSMLVRQYGLTKEAYEYWQKLKKNTEELGSIFDAQPSEVRGNIHAVSNADEPVLGYISAAQVTSKRIFVDPYYLNMQRFGYYAPPTVAECKEAGIAIAPQSSFESRLRRALFSGDSLLTGSVGTNGVIIGYTYAPAECVDCRRKIKGSTLTRPPYWPAYL